jgi:hypothetical protein
VPTACAEVDPISCYSLPHGSQFQVPREKQTPETLERRRRTTVADDVLRRRRFPWSSRSFI